MKIILHSNALTRRGDSVTVSSYARALKKFADIECEIAFERQNFNNDYHVIMSLNEEFKLIPYDSISELDEYVQKNNIELIYWLKNGHYDNKFLKKCKNVIHVVFNVVSPHGDKYVYVSKWLADEASRNYFRRVFSSKQVIKYAIRNPSIKYLKEIYNHFALNSFRTFEFVPHIVDLPKPINGKFRKSHGYLPDHFIIGRIGGYDQFNIELVKEWVREVVVKDIDTYFVFINTEHFIDHPKVKYIDEYLTEQDKADFIDGCNMMLHAREMGETFGYAIAESLFLNTPIASYYYGKDGNHREMLKGTGLLFKSKNDLSLIYENIKNGEYASAELNLLVENFSPNKVAREFKRIFID